MPTTAMGGGAAVMGARGGSVGVGGVAVAPSDPAKPARIAAGSGSSSACGRERHEDAAASFANEWGFTDTKNAAVRQGWGLGVGYD